MIKKVTLKNFQSNKNTTVELSPRVNVVFGKSDSGKSSFIRGICANIYRDQFFISYGENEGSSLVEFDDFTVERKCRFAETKKCPSCGEKTDGKQQCKCGEILFAKPSSDKYVIGENEYDKFGKTLPDFIKEKIRMFPVRFVDVEDNIQFFSQHEDFFFIGKSYSGGKRNKIISSLFPDSDRVDFLIKKFNADASFRKTKIDVFDQELAELKKKIEDGKDSYDMIRILVEEIQELREDLDEMKEESARITILKSKINETQRIINYEDKIKKIGIVLDKIKEKSSEVIEIRKQRNNLSEISSKVSKNYDFETQTFEIKEIMALNGAMVSNERLSFLNKKLSIKYDFELKSFDDPKITVDEFYSINRKSQRLRKLKLHISDKNLEIDYQQENYAVEMSNILKKKEEFKKFLSDSKTICPLIQEEFCDKCKGILSK